MEQVVVERSFQDPITIEGFMARGRDASWCFEQHSVRLVHSVLSLDGKRMICLFQAPDAESVRVANRIAGLPFDRVWTASVIEPPGGEG